MDGYVGERQAVMLMGERTGGSCWGWLGLARTVATGDRWLWDFATRDGSARTGPQNLLRNILPYVTLPAATLKYAVLCEALH